MTGSRIAGSRAERGMGRFKKGWNLKNHRCLGARFDRSSNKAAPQEAKTHYTTFPGRVNLIITLRTCHGCLEGATTFIGSYLGDMAPCELRANGRRDRGMAQPRVARPADAPAATACEAHCNLMLTKVVARRNFARHYQPRPRSTQPRVVPSGPSGSFVLLSIVLINNRPLADRTVSPRENVRLDRAG
jgi:hypothetical protein